VKFAPGEPKMAPLDANNFIKFTLNFQDFSFWISFLSYNGFVAVLVLIAQNTLLKECLFVIGYR